MKEEDLAPPDKTSNVEGDPLSRVQTSWMAFYAFAGCLWQEIELWLLRLTGAIDEGPGFLYDRSVLGPWQDGCHSLVLAWALAFLSLELPNA